MRFPPGIAPALLTRISTPGNAAAILSTLALSERSAANTSTRTFDLRAISAWAALRSAAVRAMSTTLQPSSAMALAVARPMPLEAPVMRAVLPASLRSMVALEGFGMRRGAATLRPRAARKQPRPKDVPRAQRNAISAFTRVFDALWRCAADPGSRGGGRLLPCIGQANKKTSPHPARFARHPPHRSLRSRGEGCALLRQAAKPARWRGNEARRGPHHCGAAPGGVRRVARRAAVRGLRRRRARPAGDRRHALSRRDRDQGRVYQIQVRRRGRGHAGRAAGIDRGEDRRHAARHRRPPERDVFHHADRAGWGNPRAIRDRGGADRQARQPRATGDPLQGQGNGAAFRRETKRRFCRARGRGAMIPFELAEPRSLKEAIALLDGADEAVRPIAGGTALMLMMKAGVFHPTRLIALRRVADGNGIELAADGSLRLGSLATLGALERTKGLGEASRR